MMAEGSDRSIRVCVLDMQPIMPPIGGGRVRLLGLYHALGRQFVTQYLGTFDWPGEKHRKLALSASLTETDIPLSPAHFREEAKWRGFAENATIIDATFPILGRLSEEFLSSARSHVARSDVVVFSHPWIYPLVTEQIDSSRQLIVYDAQNAEGLLRFELLGERPFNREIAKGVASAESFLARTADLVVGCSEDDLAFFRDTYLVDRHRLCFVPNGVFIEAVRPANASRKEAARGTLGLGGHLALFLGSNYRPNVEAAEFIARELAPNLPEVQFVICGGVGGAPALRHAPANVRLIGILSEEQKLAYLQAADVALNPMFAGSGSNIKMFDFMAAGLPVVATVIGARGIAGVTTAGIIVSDAGSMPDHIRRLMVDAEERRRLGAANRKWVEAEFAWETLSPRLGERIRDTLARKAGLASPGSTPAEASEAARAVAPLSAESRHEPEHLAILSTLGIRCGIAEYTTYLAEALLERGTRTTLFANVLEGHEDHAVPLPSALVDASIVRAWRYDVGQRARSQVDVEKIVRTLRAKRIPHLNVQYHVGFFAESTLLNLVRSATEEGVAASITLHNSRGMASEVLASVASLPVTIFVHNQEEQLRLRQLGIRRVRTLPQGVRGLGRTEAPVAGSGGRPLLATFGFLRAHKGLLELIEALEILTGVFPDIRLLAQTALYPSSDSADYLQKVMARVVDLGPRDRVELDTGFVPIDIAISRLGAADVVVLPYGASDEGASAAAAAALAARVPVIATRARIFKDISGIAYLAEDNSPPVLAAAIGNVLSNPALGRHLREQSVRAAEERSWRNIAKQFVRLTTDDRAFVADSCT